MKRVLEEAGCRFHRQGKGDHEFWHSPVTNRYFPVDGKLLSRHTANEIMKQAGLTHRVDGKILSRHTANEIMKQAGLTHRFR